MDVSDLLAFLWNDFIGISAIIYDALFKPARRNMVLVTLEILHAFMSTADLFQNQLF